MFKSRRPRTYYFLMGCYLVGDGIPFLVTVAPLFSHICSTFSLAIFEGTCFATLPGHIFKHICRLVHMSCGLLYSFYSLPFHCWCGFFWLLVGRFHYSFFWYCFLACRVVLCTKMFSRNTQNSKFRALTGPHLLGRMLFFFFFVFVHFRKPILGVLASLFFRACDS